MNNKISTLEASEGKYGMTSVVLANCTKEVISLITLLSIHQGISCYQCDKENTIENPKICFFCPTEFLNFIDTDMGRTLFERMGVQDIVIRRIKK